jgi:hypothetical protein
MRINVGQFLHFKKKFGANSYKGFDQPTPFLNFFQKFNIFTIF